MKQPQRKTRLDDFLEAYQPLGKSLLERISDRVNCAGLSPDDPTSLQIAHETIIEARLRQHARALHDLPKNIELAVKSALQAAEITDQRNRAAYREEFSQQVAGTVSDVLEAEIPRWERSLHLRMVARLGLTAVLISMIGMTAGYLVGHKTGVAKAGNAAEWGLTDEGQTARALAESGSLYLVAECLGEDWYVEQQNGYNICRTPQGTGWYIP